MYRLILYDTEIYTEPEKTVDAYGVVSEVKQKEKTVEITLAKVDIIKGTAIKDNEKLLIYLKSSDYLKIGQKISIHGNSKPFDTAGNPGTFDASGYYHNKGYAYIVFADKAVITDESYSYIKEWLRKISDNVCGIYDKMFNKHEADIMSAIVLGRRERIKDEDIYLYRQSGCLHLFAVSGLHVSMISAIFLWLVNRFPVNFSAGRTGVLIVLVLYGMLTGFSISCMRAVIMIIMSIAARLLGRRYDVLSAIAVAGIIILLINPKELFSAAFLLSFGAVCSVTLVSPYIIKHAAAKKLQSFYTAFSASFMTMPVVLYYYNDVPLYSVIVNIIVIPVMGLLFVMGVLSPFVSVLCAPLGSFCAGSVHYILLFYEKLCSLFSENVYGLRIRGHAGSLNIIAYYIFFIVLLIVIKMCKKTVVNRIVCIIAIIPMIFALTYGRDSARLEVTMLDVGQGDGIYIKTPDGKTVMVDGGSSDKAGLAEYTIEPFLYYMGDSRIDMWIITHMDSDHYNGLLDILNRSNINKIVIDTLVLPDIAEKEKEFMELLKYKNCFGKIYFIGSGNHIRTGQVDISCIHPLKSMEHYSNANDYSLVFNLNYGDFDMLFTGDISEKEESEISGNLSKCDVLKVAHHGSGYSSSDEFLDKTGAKLAVISAGEKNRYGHPDKNVLNRLDLRNIDADVTMNTGAIIISTDGKTIWENTYKNNIQKIYSATDG